MITWITKGHRLYPDYLDEDDDVEGHYFDEDMFIVDDLFRKEDEMRESTVRSVREIEDEKKKDPKSTVLSVRSLGDNSEDYEENEEEEEFFEDYCPECGSPLL